MNILVTGGAGYIGSHTCKALSQQGYTPVVYDNLCTGHKELVKWGPFEHGDILDTTHLQKILNKYDIQGIIHFAALSSVPESCTEPGKYYKNNIGGTLSILEAMRLESVKNIVVSSTCAVYGTPDRLPITETTTINPINPYGFSKAAMERMLKDFHTAHGLNSVSLRYFNAAGADEELDTGEWHEPEGHLIPRVIMAAHDDIPALEIYGNNYDTPDGTCTRDYVHVKDLAIAHVQAIQHLQENDLCTAINLGTGQGYSVQEIIATTAAVMQQDIPHRFAPRRAGDPPKLVAQADLAKNVLNWIPNHSELRHIIETAAQWYEKLRYIKNKK